MKRQIFLCILIILVCSFLGGFIITTASETLSESRRIEQIRTKIDDLDDFFTKVDYSEKRITQQFEELTNINVQITKELIKDRIVDGEYRGNRLFSDGMVVRYVDGEIEYPEHEGRMIPEVDEKTLLSGDVWNSFTIENEYGYYDEYFVLCIPLSDGYYYVDWTDATDWYQLYYSNSNSFDLVNLVEQAYDCRLAIIDDENKSIYWSPDMFQDEFDVTLEQERFSKHEAVTLDDQNYITDYFELEDMKWKVFTLVGTEASLFDNINWLFSFVIITVILSITLITWTFSLKKMVTKHILTEAQITRYDPDKVRIYNYVVAVLVTLAVFIYSLLISGMISLRKDTSRGEELVNYVRLGLANDIMLMENSNEDQREWYTYFANKIGELIEDNQKLPDKQTLVRLNEILNAQYIIIYDENGKELACSANYTGLELSTAANDPNTDFRRLLHGVDSVIHEAAQDDFTGLKSQKLGVKYTVPGTDKYGALIIALEPYILTVDYDSYVTDRIRGLTQPGDYLLVAKNENGDIVNCSDYDLIGFNVEDFGLTMDQVLSNKINIHKINGVKYYVMTSPDLNNDTTYYYMAVDTYETSGMHFRFSLLFTVLFLIPFLLCLRISTHDYTREFFDANVLNGQAPVSDNFIKVMLTDGRNKRSQDITERFSFFPTTYWRNSLPEDKARAVFNLILGLIVILFYYWFTHGGDDQNMLLFNYVLRGEWQRGVNLFAIFSIFVLLIMTTLFMAFARYLFLVISLPLDTKGETICRLAYNLLQYVVLIANLYFAFGYLGFDTRSILASIGFISLAISLGSRDLVTDIVAGLTIVFEGVFQVGDMVEISGYRGQVQEVGVRSTKVVGQGNNVKIINNRDVKNVVNLTRMNSWLPLEIKIPASESLEAVEAILEEELPKIGKKNSKIISGPYYYGILSFDKGSPVLSILTECREEDRNNLTRYLNKELLELFKRKSITLG